MAMSPLGQQQQQPVSSLSVQGLLAAGDSAVWDTDSRPRFGIFPAQ